MPPLRILITNGNRTKRVPLYKNILLLPYLYLSTIRNETDILILRFLVSFCRLLFRKFGGGFFLDKIKKEEQIVREKRSFSLSKEEYQTKVSNKRSRKATVVVRNNITGCYRFTDSTLLISSYIDSGRYFNS